ncbi:hypothetical protein HPB50_013034 [Hyalomma asiaticum]|uniref:Uncharacterized protein n=1 Tax=Hyalomma asiaticum TaxID=266040 RepID=A0ACB7S2F3_HYAAI|nr:hypothetical protein HPB50_013034 [Hyalomma asiaticum]
MEENVLQQRPRPVVIVTRKGMYAITAMIAVIGVVCVTALSYSFTDTGKVKISFRPIEEFGFKLKRGRPRRVGFTVPAMTRPNRRSYGAPAMPMAHPAGAAAAVASPSASPLSEAEELCGNNTVVGIDADKAVVHGNTLVGSVLNGSLIEIINGTVFVNGVQLNCSWYIVNVTLEFPSTDGNYSGVTYAPQPTAKTKNVSVRNGSVRQAASLGKGHKRRRKDAASMRATVAKTVSEVRDAGLQAAATAKLEALSPVNVSVLAHDMNAMNREDTFPDVSVALPENGTVLKTSEMHTDTEYRTSRKTSLAH